MNEQSPHRQPLPADAQSCPGAQFEQRLAEIAALAAMDYERCRDELAAELGVRKSVLDNERKRRLSERSERRDQLFEEVRPVAHEVNGAELLDQLQAEILRFCILPDHGAPIIAAWILFAWVHDSFEISPILALTSPEKRCGKTTVLSVIAALVPRPLSSVNISAAAMFRVIEKYRPTLLIDEADTYLDARNNGDIRGMLNGGHNAAQSIVWRSVGEDHEPRPFNVWAPKVIAMIGALPDTLEDRSLVIRLRRRRSSELVERFRHHRFAQLLPLRQRAARWAIDNADALLGCDPDIPAALHDRAADNAHALCAIADLVGAHWPATLRAALLDLHQRARSADEQSSGAMLLRDIAAIFATTGHDQIGSTVLVDALCELEESPWPEYRGGQPITTRRVAQLLKGYDIAPRRNAQARFYSRGDFTDAFARYLPAGPRSSVTSDTSVMQRGADTEKPPRDSGMITVASRRAGTPRDASLPAHDASQVCRRTLKPQQ